MAAPIPGWQDLIVCSVDTKPEYDHMCGFNDLMLLIKNGITDLILIATIATAFVFMWAGILLITAGFRGDMQALDKAKKMFGNILKGYGIIIVAWAVVYTIMSVLVDPAYSLLGHV